MYPSFSLAGVIGYSANNEGKNSLSDIFMWENRAARALLKGIGFQATGSSGA